MNQRGFVDSPRGSATGAPEVQEPRLEVRQVSKSFLGTQALEDVNLTIAPGQVLALIGENGAGKSTLIRILSGAHRPDRGEVLVNGLPVDITGPKAAEDLGIATVYQELSLFPDLSVAENLMFGRFPRNGVIDWRRIGSERYRGLGLKGGRGLRRQTAQGVADVLGGLVGGGAQYDLQAGLRGLDQAAGAQRQSGHADVFAEGVQGLVQAVHSYSSSMAASSASWAAFRTDWRMSVSA